MRFTIYRDGQDFGMPEPDPVVSPDGSAVAANRLPDVRRLLSPVNAGVNAARHVLWFISYHAGGSRQHR
jgi:hypothetical protein